MSDTIKIVKDFYDQNAQVEWDRLEGNRPEFALACRFMDRYIKAGDKVLDIGGGPGRYSIYLAEKGCDVMLFDLSHACIEFAKGKAAERSIGIKTIEGDAREADKLVKGQFDHVLLMGPMYHLLEEEDRIRAVNAALNLLKPNGVIFISFISSYGGIIYSMKYAPESILIPEIEFCYKLFEDDLPFAGVGFTQNYFVRHKDVLPFMSRFSVEKLHFFGQESILSPCEDKFKEQPEEIKNKWLDLAFKVCEREDLLSFSEHLMYIGRKL